MNNIVYGILIFIVGLAIGVIGGMGIDDSTPEGELKIVESTTSIGISENNSINRQVYSYSFVLYNDQDKSVYIDSAHPMFKTDFSKRLLTEDYSIVVDKRMEPGSSLGISGNVGFNAANLSKEEILALEPFIVGVNVSSIETLPYP